MKRDRHDEYFTNSFSDKEVVADFLRHNLAPKVLERLDLSTLVLADRSFSPNKHRHKRHADLLYTVKQGNGQEVLILLHFEHQSTPNPLMGVRVLEYQTGAVRAHLTLTGGKGKVPPIITFVFFHSAQAWQGAKSIAELFTDFELYVEQGLRRSFLVTLAPAMIKELAKQGTAALPQILLALQPTGHVTEEMQEIVPLLNQAPQHRKEESMDYAITVNDGTEEEFLEELGKFDPETAKNYKTMFERALKRNTKEVTKKVREASLKEGVQKGVQKGLQKGLETLQFLLQKGALSQQEFNEALEKLKEQ